MASRLKEHFNGSANTTDAHNTLQTVAGNATWLNEFTPCIDVSQKRIADVLVRLFHSLELCCATACEFSCTELVN